MPLKPVRYRSLRELLKRELIHDEHPLTAGLIDRLRPVKQRGWFSRGEFFDMCKWKSPRAMRHYRRNSASRIGRVSRAVLATRSERRRIELLTSLRGVNVPMASAILTLIDPKRYGVLDIRVWQLLCEIKSVTKNPRGLGFTFNHWYHYLRKLRHHARERKVPVRTIEYTVFQCHKKFQKGRLYDQIRWGATRKASLGRVTT